MLGFVGGYGGGLHYRLWENVPGCGSLCEGGKGMRRYGIGRRRRRRGGALVVFARAIKEEEEVKEDIDVDAGSNGRFGENGVVREGRGKKRRKGGKVVDEKGSVSVVNESNGVLGAGEGESEGLRKDAVKKEKGTVRLFRFRGKDVSVPGKWLLYTVPFLWGSFGPAVRLLFTQDGAPPPSIFNTERLLVSVLVYSPILFAEASGFMMARKQQNTREDRNDIQDADKYSYIRVGLELGLWVFLANVCQVIGLQQTSASRAAFFNQLQTVFVPVAAALLGIGEVSKSTFAAAAVAVFGVALLSLDKSHGVTSSLTGDSLEILSAVFFSAYIIRLGAFANKVRTAPLVATKIAMQAILSVSWVTGMEIMLSQGAQPAAGTVAPILHLTSAGILINVAVVAWTGLMSSAVSGWAQTKGQETTPASEAAVIFATQPLWASAIAAIGLGESFGPKGIMGGLLIVVSTLISSRGSGSKDTS